MTKHTIKKTKQKKIALINDLSGYGRCSLTVAIPIISALKVQCCPVPTSILSNHTGFPVYFMDDYTDKMEPYLAKWKELQVDFDGIVSGFLGSVRQIEIVKRMIADFRGENTKVIVDPIMGDKGKIYATYTDEMCREMKKLVCLADVVTPNVTEACILSGRVYKESGWTKAELKHMAEDILALGPGAVVITGVPAAASLTNVILEKDQEILYQRTRRVGQERHGTGDIFAAVVSAMLITGWTLQKSAAFAAKFVKACIEKSDELHIPLDNGVCFEEVLPMLMRI